MNIIQIILIVLIVLCVLMLVFRKQLMILGEKLNKNRTQKLSAEGENLNRKISEELK